MQVYQCAASGGAASGGLAWRLAGPEAALVDAAGQVAGRHHAGPTREAADGSRVVGEAVASGGGVAGAVPWLVLRARSHEGAGVFAGVQYVVRSRTVGGAAPAGCAGWLRRLAATGRGRRCGWRTGRRTRSSRVARRSVALPSAGGVCHHARLARRGRHE